MALLIDGINDSKLKKEVSSELPGSINVLEAFFKEKYPNFDERIINNFHDIMTLRSKKMPIHEDDPRIIQVILKWEQRFHTNWSALWIKALMKFRESLFGLQELFTN